MHEISILNFIIYEIDRALRAVMPYTAACNSSQFKLVFLSLSRATDTARQSISQDLGLVHTSCIMSHAGYSSGLTTQNPEIRSQTLAPAVHAAIRDRGHAPAAAVAS